MNKNVLIISSSPRKNGNSERLAKAFQEGAKKAGNTVEKIALRDTTIQFCKGCLACQKTQRCILQDDANAIVEKMLYADVLVFATPVYFYDMCGQMKTLLDRSNPLFPAEYAFRDVYLLATAADEEERAIEGTITSLQGWLSCFEQTTLVGVVRGVNVTHPGDIEKTPNVLQMAYTMGEQV